MREANSPWEGNTFTAAMKLRFQQGNLPILFLSHMFNPAEVVTSLSGHVLFTSSTSGYLSHILVTILPNTFSCHPLVTSRKSSSRFQSQALIMDKDQLKRMPAKIETVKFERTLVMGTIHV